MKKCLSGVLINRQLFKTLRRLISAQATASKLKHFALRGVFFALLFISTVVRADDFRVPALTGPVVDDAGVIDSNVRAALENGLRTLATNGGTQITVLTVQSLGGLAIEQASIKTTDAWKLGGAKTDNGVLVLIAPAEKKVRIEVGQGLEGALPDAFANRIVQNTILPYFRKGDYSNGALQGVVQIISKTDPNVDPASLFNGADRERDVSRDVGGRGIPIWLIILGVFVLISLFRGRGGGGGRMSPWGAGAVGYGLGRLGGGGGGWGGGGGGWSGGGGGFSGGGASGGW
jgi:uncharacterized protein